MFIDTLINGAGLFSHIFEVGKPFKTHSSAWSFIERLQGAGKYEYVTCCGGFGKQGYYVYAYFVRPHISNGIEQGAPDYIR